MSDLGHKLTDKELDELERRITSVYREAQKDLQKTINDYFAKFIKRDARQKALLDAGEITNEYYTQWRLAQIGRGERFIDLRNKLAERVTKANEVAAAYINDSTPGIYSLNRNYAAYTIEQVHGNVGFTMWDERTVRQLIKDKPDIMPYYPPERAVARGFDLAYGKRKITENVTSSILQGKGIKKIADDLQTDITDMGRVSAIRAARTAVTGAQNAGRQDAYIAAKEMGLKLRKRWIATKDGRTRHDHGMADGQIVALDKPFEVGGYDMMFPGDMQSSAPGYLLYNCRCTMATVEKEGIEAEPRQMRVQTPEYLAAIEAENKERKKYKKALKDEQSETDEGKKKLLREKRLKLKKSLGKLEEERRGTTKNIVVNEMTFAEWQEWVKKRG